MKNGELFVNGKDFDEDHDLYHNYYISANELELIDETELPSADQIRSYPSGDSVMLPLTRALYNKYKSRIQLSKYISSDATVLSQPGNEKNTWTVDNFGPISVPEGYYLALGDNRHNSLDSRYVGFIKKSDCKATVLFK